MGNGWFVLATGAILLVRGKAMVMVETSSAVGRPDWSSGTKKHRRPSHAKHQLIQLPTHTALQPIRFDPAQRGALT